MMQVNKFLLEFICTGVLVYVVLATGNGIAIGAAYALLILVGVSLGGSAHYNPAVTIALTAFQRTTPQDMLPMILVQIFGGVCALEIYKRLGHR